MIRLTEKIIYDYKTIKHLYYFRRVIVENKKLKLLVQIHIY